MTIEDTALKLIQTGIAAAAPARVIADSVRVTPKIITINGYKIKKGDFDKVYLLGIGKASLPMAKALVELVSIDEGAIVTNEDVGEDNLGPVEVYSGSHPTPSSANVKAARRILELAEEADENTLVLFMISGGGSALYSLPAGELKLDDLIAVNESLLGSGASIDEINTVRKHLSSVKGGRTARAAFPASVVSLVLSDVVGDDLTTISSGPTVPDPTTFSDAARVLEKYGLSQSTPPAVRKHIQEGIGGNLKETPKGELPNVHNFILGNNMNALEAVKEEGERLGYNTLILSSEIEGEAREVGRVHAGIALKICNSGNPVPPPALVISGGELTVSGTAGSGHAGGPNREFVMGAVDKIRGLDDLLIAAVDTDGIDGRGKSGAFATGETAERLEKSPSAYLREHSTQEGFDKIGTSIDLGKTGTNVNDLRIIIVE